MKKYKVKKGYPILTVLTV